MLNLGERIINLSRQLLPTGRAWRMSIGSNMERYYKALAVSEAKAHNDATAIFYSLLPDNDEFTEDDATDWERRLGMISNPLVSLANRKAAILRKMAAPGVNPAKGHYLWLEKQLQDAGFDVYVYENIFPVYPTGYTTVAPNSLYGNANFVKLRHGQKNHGGARSGRWYNNLIANSITQAGDNNFNIGANFRASFFIGGSTIGSYATVPATREEEFRQLILTIKQVQNVGFLFINYT